MPRSDEELLGLVYGRSARIKRRRRIIRGTGLVSVVAVLALALAPRSDNDRNKVDTVNVPTTSTTFPQPGPDTGTGTGVGTGSHGSAVPGDGSSPVASRPGLTLPGGEPAPIPASGGRIAFINDPDDGTSPTLNTVNADGTDLRVLTSLTPNVPGVVRWSPDGTRIAFIDGSSAFLTVINQDGSGRKSLTAAGIPVFDFDWAPDGQSLVYVTARPRGAYLTYGPPGIDSDGDIGIISIDGLMQRPITTDTNSDYKVTWSRDGTTIFFVRYGAAPGGDGIYAVGTDGLGLRVVRAGTFDLLEQSRDGAWIAAIDFQTTGFVEIFGTDGSNVRQIAAGYYYATPRWSPDDLDIVLVGDGPVTVVASDGSRSTQVALMRFGHAAWLPDGRSVIACGMGPLSRADRDGSTVETIATVNYCRAVDVAAA